jgi:hypothetical protein
VLNHRDHRRVQAQVFGRAATGDDQRVVVLGRTAAKVGIQREVVAGLLAVGLVAFEVVHGGAHLSPAFLPGQTACTVWPTISSAWKGTMVS